MAKIALTNSNNCFRKALLGLGIDGNSQDNGSDLAYLLLSAEADNLDFLIGASLAVGADGSATGDDYTVADTYTNCYQEVLHRLRKYDGYAFKCLTYLFNDRDSSVGNPQ